MRPILRSCVFLLAAIALLAEGDLPWKAKPVSQWNEQDAKRVLADSPWVKQVHLQRIPDLSVAQRVDGGNWEAGISGGVGLAGTGLLGPKRAAEAIAKAHARPDPGTVMVRWESALPVQAAEAKLGETGASAGIGDYYAIAVYNITPPFRWNLANQLRGLAALKRDQKKDLKPKRVEVLWHDSGLVTVVYLFSRSAEITRKDLDIRFQAQIGRLFVSQSFAPQEMQFEGKPEF
jgi:hypothetical protein